MDQKAIEVLEELGLTKSEGKVYESLVEFGTLSSAEASAKSGVSYSKIYNVLGSLIQRGLVKVIPEKTKKFSPADPDSFIKLIEEKERKLSEAKLKVKELKKFYDIKDKNPVVIAFGRKGFHKILDEMETIKKFSYNIKWTSEYREDWVRKRIQRMKEGKEYKELVRYDKETKSNVDKWIKINKTIRKIDNEGIAISVSDDHEVMISLIKSNMTLLIKDKPFAKLMKKMFLETYKNAEDIK